MKDGKPVRFEFKYENVTRIYEGIDAELWEEWLMSTVKNALVHFQVPNDPTPTNTITHPAPAEGACLECDGSGLVIEYSYGRLPEFPEETPCTTCNGTGRNKPKAPHMAYGAADSEEV